LDFPDPKTVNPRRPPASYNLNGAGFHNCPGTAYAQVTIVEIVKAVFQLKNVRRAPGDAGKLHRITEIINETETDFYIQRNGSVSAWPGSMHIVVRSFACFLLI
jgi:cytochrome P450